MNVRSTAVVVAALAWLAVSVTPAAAQEMKKVRGTVVSMAGASLTVSVDGKDMTFAYDAKTDVIARGGTTAQKAAKEAGKGGVTLADVLKKGDRVEVSYHEMDGRMMAMEIRAGVAAPQGAVTETPESLTATGEVMAVAASSITVKSGADSLTFMIGANTTIIGTGLSTMTKEMKAEGKATTLADAVGVGDQVAVTYTDGTHKMASEVRVTSKKQ